MDKLTYIKDQIMSNGHDVYNAIALYLPKFLVALVIALVGYFIAVTLDKWVVKIAKKLKLDSLISKTNLDEQLEDAGVKLKISKFLGTAVRWIILIITILIVADMYNLVVVQSFITGILGIIGKIIVALFVFAIAVYAARFAGSLGRAVAEYVEFGSPKLISDIIKGIIYFVAVIQILDILGAVQIIALIGSLIQAVFYGAALAVGLAFGLGGQEKAKDFIERVRK